MYRDPHIRDHNDRPPFIPWTDTRFRWPDPYDEEVRMLRERLPDGGKGLYLLGNPFGVATGKVLVEAYYPEDIRDHYARDWLDPMRKADMGLGRLVAIKVHEKIKPSMEPLNMRHIMEIRRNARNARSRLKRDTTSSYRKQELEGARQKEEGVIYDAFVESWAEAKEQTRKYVLTPHVGPATHKKPGKSSRQTIPTPI